MRVFTALMTAHRRHNNYLAIAIIAFVLGAFIYLHVRARVAFSRLSLGMPEATLVARLGEPAHREAHHLFCAPYQSWSGECPRPEAALRFLHFRYGVDRWIVVGIDAARRVSFLSLGDA